jgi:thioesterase domain-containing protein
MLREQGVKLWAEHDQLKCSAPAGTLDPLLRKTIAARREDILALLRKSEGLRNRPPAIVPMKGSGSRPPIFAVSGHGGDVFYMLGFARNLDVEQPMFGVQPPGLDGSSEPLRTVEALAAYEIEQIRRYRPRGPYLIVGHCAGGTIAFEVAQQLTAAGEKVAFLALIGSPFPTMFRPGVLAWVNIRMRLRRYLRALSSVSEFTSKVRRRLRKADPLSDADLAKFAARQRVESATVAAVRNYKPRPYSGHVDVFVTSDRWHKPHLWRSMGSSVQEHILGNFEIDDLLLGPDVGVLARKFQGVLSSRRIR